MAGSSTCCDSVRLRLNLTRSIGCSSEPLAPTTMQSAAPRSITRTPSARASSAEVSREVIVLLGPRASSPIETWQADMLGSRRSSHIGAIRPRLSSPQRVQLIASSASASASGSTNPVAAARSSGRLEIRPAPNDTPTRSGSSSPRASPASSMAKRLAATPNWMSRDITFSSLREGR